MEGNGVNGGGLLPGLGMEAARGLLCSVLISGREATLLFTVATPSDVAPSGKIAITLPASGLPALRSALHKAMDMMDRQRGWWPTEFQVGHPEGMRNTVVITIDSAPNELTFLFADIVAKQLAENIMSDIIGRRDAAERAKLPSGLLTPRRGLIVPGKG